MKTYMKAGTEDSRHLECPEPTDRRRRDHRGRRGSVEHSGLVEHRGLHWDTGTLPGITLLFQTSTAGISDPSSSLIISCCFLS